MAWLTEANGGVPIAPFREAFEKSELTATEAAERAGMMRDSPRGRIGDGSWLRRRLGLATETTNGYKLQKPAEGFVTYDVAVKLCKALELDPVDYGV